MIYHSTTFLVFPSKLISYIFGQVNLTAIDDVNNKSAISEIPVAEAPENNTSKVDISGYVNLNQLC